MVNRWTTLAASMLLLAAWSASAEEVRPATKPAAASRPSARQAFREGAIRWRDRLGTYDPGAAGPITDQERVEIENFMKKYSPRRWQKFQDVREERKENILRLIRNQYRALQRMKEEDPKVYQLRIDRLPIEDQMFAIAWQLKHDDPTDPTALRAQLRDNVRQFVDNSLEERKIRIERQQERVRQQQESLAQEQEAFKQLLANKQARIDKGVADIENEKGDALKDLAGPAFGRKPAPSPATQPSADSGDSH